jgi:hypothetical protein
MNETILAKAENEGSTKERAWTKQVGELRSKISKNDAVGGYLGFKGGSETVDGVTLATVGKSGKEGITFAVTQEDGSGVEISTDHYKGDAIAFRRAAAQEGQLYGTEVRVFTDGTPAEVCEYDVSTGESTPIVMEHADIDAFIEAAIEEADKGIDTVMAGPQVARDRKKEINRPDGMATWIHSETRGNRSW